MATAPQIPELGRGKTGLSEQGHFCLTPFLTLALVTSASMGWLALKIFCASCWGLGAGKVQVKDLAAPTPPILKYGCGLGSVPPAAHRLSCFQRWKKSCAAISVGWKNLLMVTGSLRVMDWGAPPYLAGGGGRAVRPHPSPSSSAHPPIDSPKAHR